MIERLISKIARCLDKNKIPYMIIGGQAVLLYATPRLTKYIDITIGIDTDQFALLANVTQQLKLRVLSHDAQRFAEETKVFPVEDPQSKIRVDFIFSYTPYEKAALKRVKKVLVGGYRVKFASLEDLIIHKMIASRAVDEEDVKNVLVKNAKLMDFLYIEKWLGDFSQIAGQGYILQRFKKFVQEST